MKMTPINVPAITPRIRMRASIFGRGIGAFAGGTRVGVDVYQCVTADVSPTFLKDAVPGVRAWSPPV